MNGVIKTGDLTFHDCGDYLLITGYTGKDENLVLSVIGDRTYAIGWFFVYGKRPVSLTVPERVTVVRAEAS